jgi:hypothetical protein
MAPGNQLPGGLKLAAVVLRRCLTAIPLVILEGRSRVLGCGKLNDVCCEKVAGYQKIKNRTEYEVLSTVVVASYAYKDTVL